MGRSVLDNPAVLAKLGVLVAAAPPLSTDAVDQLRTLVAPYVKPAAAPPRRARRERCGTPRAA